MNPEALRISAEDPGTGDVVALLERHLGFAREVTPAGGVFAFDLDALRQPTVSFYCAREHGELVGIAALCELDARQGEIKSMHTAAEARGRGVGRALVNHLVEVARDRGYRRVCLETGNFPAFEPARSLYTSCGFQPVAAFGDYVDSPTSACMALDLEPPR